MVGARRLAAGVAISLVVGFGTMGLAVAPPLHFGWAPADYHGALGLAFAWSIGGYTGLYVVPWTSERFDEVFA